MPTITFDKNEILNISGVKLTDKDLRNKIPMLGTDLEEVTNKEIIVEIFPNRPDLLSAQGFARALASFTGKKTGLKNYSCKKSNFKVIVEKGMDKVRPYTVCAVIKNLKLNNQKIKDIIQIQEKLHVTFARNRKKAAIGVYPLENIVFPVYFKPLDPRTKFQPLESRIKMTGEQIVKQHSSGKEYGHLLDGLKKFPFFVDSNNEILSLPPLINSHNTGKVTEKTTDVFVEVSGWDLRTQESCLNMLVTSLADMGGKVYSVEVVYPDNKLTTPDLTPRKMNLDLKYINKLLGLNLNLKQAYNLLKKMGFGFDNKVLIPCYRTDILHQADLAEDIAIAYGYDNIKEVIPEVATIGKEDHLDLFIDYLRDIVVGMGFIEVKNYDLTSKEKQTSMINKKRKLVRIENSISQEFNVLRASLLSSLMHTLRHNKNREYPQEIFEIGTVYKEKETENFSGVIASKNSDYTSIRRIVDSLLESLGTKPSYDELEDSSFIPGRCASIKVKGKTIGKVGEIHPQVLTNWNLEVPVSGFELNIEKLMRLF